MRRGRPTVGQVEKQNLSPIRGATSDPWAILDSSSQQIVDEVSMRFPSLDQFSLLHDGGKFDFDKNSLENSENVDTIVPEKLTDDGFALQKEFSAPKFRETISSSPDLQDVSSATIYQPIPISAPLTTPARSYVSQGTMTSSPPTSNKLPTTQNQNSGESIPPASTSPPRSTQASQKLLISYSSPENHRPPSSGLGSSTNSAKDISLRPSGTFLESNIEFLREKEINNRSSYQVPCQSRPETSDSSSSSNLDEMIENLNSKSSISLLQQSDVDKRNKNLRRYSGSKSKRSSLTCVVGTKGLLSGKFGDAFKRFELNASHQINSDVQTRISNPSNILDRECRDLSVGENPQVISTEASDYSSMHEELEPNINMEKLPPEQRREIERRRFSLEEKRVADAGAEYRKRVSNVDRKFCNTSKYTGSISYAASIQRKVQNLLDESQVSRSDSQKSDLIGHDQSSEAKYTCSSSGSGNPYASLIPPSLTPEVNADNNGCKLKGSRELLTSTISFPGKIQSIITPSKSSALSKTSNVPRPSAPPKPYHLNHMNSSTQATVKTYVHHPSLLRKDSKGWPKNVEGRNEIFGELNEKDEFTTDFSHKLPGLGRIEMVSTEINAREGKIFNKRS